MAILSLWALIGLECVQFGLIIKRKTRAILSSLRIHQCTFVYRIYSTRFFPSTDRIVCVLIKLRYIANNSKHEPSQHFAPIGVAITRTKVKTVMHLGLHRRLLCSRSRLKQFASVC